MAVPKIARIAINTNNLQSAIQAFKAGAVALYPTTGLSFEDLRKIKGLGMEILKSPYLETLREKELSYLAPSDRISDYQILDCTDCNFTNVYWTVRYHALLSQGENESDSTVLWAKDAMHVTSKDGLLVGTVERILTEKAVIKFSKPVALRDGLVIGDYRFAISQIDGGKSFISQDSVATINFPSLGTARKPVFGTPVFCNYRCNLGPEAIDENLKPYKKPIDIRFCIKDNAISINGVETTLPMQESKSMTEMGQSVTSVFSSSDRSYFILGRLEVENLSSMEHPFLPMSALKQLRRAFYQEMDQAFLKD